MLKKLLSSKLSLNIQKSISKFGLILLAISLLHKVAPVYAQSADASANTQNSAPANTPKTNNNEIEINFNDLDLESLVQLISKATGTAFLYEDTLKQSKKVTLLSTGSYKLTDAYRIFENILDINGYTTIKEGPYVRIINKADARVNQTPILRGGTTSVSQGDYVTMLLEPRATDINEIRAAITPFLSPSTLINQYNPSNLIIIRDTRAVVEKIAQLVNVLDQKGSQLEVGRYPIVNGSLQQVQKILEDILIKDGKNKIYFNSDAATNTIIAIAKPSLQTAIGRYVSQLDQAQETANYEFYPLQNSSAKDVIKLIENIFPQGTATGGSGLNIVEDTRNNSLLLIGSKQNIDKAKRFIESVDKPSTGAGSSYRVFKLNNSSSEEVTATLQLVTKSVTATALSGGIPEAPASTAPAPAQTPAVVQPRPVQSNVGNASSEINVVNDSLTNSIVVFASPGELKLIEKLISDLDQPRPQVFLEVMIMEVSLDKSLNLGIDWRAAGENGGRIAGIGLGGATSFLPSSATTLASSAAGAQVGVLGPSITYQGQTFASYSAFIKATSTDSDFNLISNPQILTVSNQEAEISVGEVRPFQTSSRIDTNNNVTNSYEYKEVGVTLKFTARIGEDDSILLKVDQSTKDVKSTGTGAATLTPTTFERNLNTNIISKNNEIVVLGGLISESETLNATKTYCLGDIPVLGLLFRQTENRRTKTNLLVYIKPRIIRTADERQELFYNGVSDFKAASTGSTANAVNNKFERTPFESYKPEQPITNPVEELPATTTEPSN